MTASTETFTSSDTGWLSVIRRYIVYTAVGHLIWEMAHIPLYTIWVEGTWGEIVFAVVHCTGGDLLIAMSTLLLALFLVGGQSWPSERAGRVLLLTVALGVSYTIFSEWLNIELREAWAYREMMPVIPVIDAGLSSILQWIVIPVVDYCWATGARPWRREPVEVAHG